MRENAAVVPSLQGETKRDVKKLAGQLVEMGYQAGALQGNLSQNAGERMMDDFRCGTSLILVAINVAARGPDAEGVGRVINFDLSDSELLFIHRAGRIERMARYGGAVTFITPDLADSAPGPASADLTPGNRSRIGVRILDKMGRKACPRESTRPRKSSTS